MAGELASAVCFQRPLAEMPGLHPKAMAAPTDKREQLLLRVAVQSHCQQGPLLPSPPLPSNTVWQKQSYSVKRESFPLLR